jgi:hypothetical protein
MNKNILKPNHQPPFFHAFFQAGRGILPIGILGMQFL